MHLWKVLHSYINRVEEGNLLVENQLESQCQEKDGDPERFSFQTRHFSSNCV